MASKIPPVPNYVYIVIRIKMPKGLGGIIGGVLFCHRGETNDVFLIGGLVYSDETLMASAIGHCRHLVNFRFTQNNCSYLAKALNGFMNHEYIKITIFYIIFLELSNGGLVTILVHWQ